MTPAELKRRKSLLASLSFAPGATPATLRADLENTHNVAASLELVRADLDWLREMGLALWDGSGSKCTERGMDVARLRAKFPGDE